MKLFIYVYETDKFEWLSHKRPRAEQKVVLNTFPKKYLKDCLPVIILRLEQKQNITK